MVPVWLGMNRQNAFCQYVKKFLKSDEKAWCESLFLFHGVLGKEIMAHRRKTALYAEKIANTSTCMSLCGLQVQSYDWYRLIM